MKPTTTTKAATAVVPKPGVAALRQEAAVTTLARSTEPRKGSSIVYVIPGLRAIVKVTRTAFEGEPPAALVLQGAPLATPKAKLTKEERAAARAAMTPAMKAARAQEIANRAVAKAAKLTAEASNTAVA